MAANFFLLSHCLSVQGDKFNILETCSRVKREDQVSGSEEENDIIDLLLPIIYTKLTELNVRCKMQNEITKDALKLASNILNSLLPDQKWAIVNIAIDDRNMFILNGYSSIPPLFGYKYNKTPILLKQKKVIEGETVGWWAIGIKGRNSHWSRIMPADLTLDDNIVEAAQKKGYIRKDEIIEYYYHVSTENIGPRMHGQAAVLINLKALKKFTTENRNQNSESLAKNNIDQVGGKINVVFDKAKGEVKADGKVIGRVRKDTNQFELCRVVLEDKNSKKREWEWEVVLEKWGGHFDIDKNSWRKVYSAAREVNQKVAQESQIKAFFITTTKTVLLNQKFF